MAMRGAKGFKQSQPKEGGGKAARAKKETGKDAKECESWTKASKAEP